MPALNDDCWLLIFKRLNLNERRAIRLTCKRFRALCDLIQIHKLVIYHRQVPVPGRLQHTNEPYGLEHTAYVVHLNRFFGNEQIVKQMRPIRALAIHGDWAGVKNSDEVDLKQLNYLELHNCTFTSPILFSSSQLEYLIIDCAYLRPMELIEAKEKEIKESRSGDSSWWFALGLEELESRRIKYFWASGSIDGVVPKKVIDSHLFDRLEEAYLCLPDLRSIGILVRKKHCPVLRRLNVIIGGRNVQQTVDSIGQADLNELFSSFSEHLTVHLFGFPFDQQHKSAMVEFFKPFDQMIQESLGHFNVEIDQQIYKHIKKWHKKVNLTQFYPMVRAITVAESSEQLNSDLEFFGRFSQCIVIEYQASPRPADLEGHLTVLANLKKVELFGANHLSTDNKLLNLFGEKCPQLDALGFDSAEKIDFGFLFKLQRLKRLSMQLAFAPPQCTLIDLVKNRRDLAGLDVCFIRSNSESKAELSDFKKRMNEMISERFEARELQFCVEIHKRKGDEFVRYRLDEVQESIKMQEHDEANMFNLIEHKRTQLGQKVFKKLFGQPAATGGKR